MKVIEYGLVLFQQSHFLFLFQQSHCLLFFSSPIAFSDSAVPLPSLISAVPLPSLISAVPLRSPSSVHSSPIMPYLLYLLIGTPLLVLVFQSFAVVIYIKNAIVNAVFLLFMLLRELWGAIRYLDTVLAMSTTIRRRCGMADRFCKAVLLHVSEAIWLIWGVEDRFMARLSSAAKPAPGLEDHSFAAAQAAPILADNFFSPADPPPRPADNGAPTSGPHPAANAGGLTCCAGYTDKGRCDRQKRHAEGGVWYCWQHTRQDPQART